MQDIVTNFKKNGKTVKICIGGAPITQEYAEKIGADGYSKDANGAVKLVDALLAHAS